MIPQRIPNRYKFSPMIALQAGEREQALYVNFKEPEKYRTLRQHVVKDGESLQSIAVDYLGYPELWFAIYEHNVEIIEHPYDNIVGRIISIPTVNAGEF